MKPTDKHQYLAWTFATQNIAKPLPGYHLESSAPPLSNLLGERKSPQEGLGPHKTTKGGYNEKRLNIETLRALDTPSLFKIKNKPGESYSHNIGSHVPYNFAIPPSDYQKTPTDPSRLGLTTGGISTTTTYCLPSSEKPEGRPGRASFTTTTREVPRNRPCGPARCKTCPILTATDELSSHRTGERFKVRIPASCKSSNVILYIGI